MIISVEELSTMMAARLGDSATWVHTMRFVHPVGDSAEPVAPGSYREGFAGGEPRCRSCRDADGAEHERTAPERQARAARDIEAQLEALEHETSLPELQRRLLELAHSAPSERMVGPWRRLAAEPASLPFGPTHDVITVRRRRSRLRRSTWEEVGRRPGWNVHAKRQVSLDALSEDHPGMTYGSSIVLDAVGTCWSLTTTPHPSTEQDAYAVVRCGEPCVVSVQRRARKEPRPLVVGGRWVRPLDAPNDIEVTVRDAIRCVLQNHPDGTGIENAHS
jgi:hypothetical protein